MFENMGFVAFGILGLALIVSVLFVTGVYRTTESVTYAVTAAGLAAVWWGITGSLASFGILAKYDALPPPLALFMAACIGLGVGLGLSPLGRALGDLPLWLLVLVQGFRLPLELVMHRAYEENIMPPELSYSGYNFDIVVGLLAWVVGGLLLMGKAPKALVWVWNLMGCLSLLIIVAIAIATSPMVHAFGTDPQHLNTWVTQVPYVWLPAVLVVAAVAGHVVITRKLRVESALELF